MSEKLLDAFNYYKKRLSTINIKFELREITIERYCKQLMLCHGNMGIYEYILHNDLTKAKQHFNICGQVAEYSNNILNDTWLTHGINYFTYTMCSDNEKLINQFGMLKIHSGIIESSQNYNCSLISLTRVISDDWEIVDNCMVNLNRNRNNDLYSDIIFNVLLAFKKKDWSLLEQSVSKLEAHELKKARLKLKFEEEYISILSLAIMKLANIKGANLTSDSKKIPQQLLEINSLDSYSTPYEFINTYYNQLGITLN